MKRRNLFAAALLLASGLAPAQTLPTTPRLPGVPPVPTTLEERRKALAQVTHDYWEDVLKHSPELASLLGDTRYNDQVTNFTSAAYNDAVAREQNYLMQLAVIDLAGFTEEEKQQYEALENRFEADQKAVDDKPWQTPINATSSFYSVYPQLAQTLPFNTAKNYEDWTARLRILPEAFAQAMQDMSLGIDEHRVPAKDVLDKSLAEVTTLAHQNEEESPLAAPTKKFPSSIRAAEQDRIKETMLDAVADDAQAGYLRLERFLRASYLNAAGAGNALPGTRDAQLLSVVLASRLKAQQELGSKFDTKAFHDEVLKVGLLPIEQIRKEIDAWIAAAK